MRKLFGILSLNILILPVAFGQREAWKLRVTVIKPPSISVAQVPAAFKAEMKQMRESQMSDDFIRKNERSFLRMVENRAKKITIAGAGLLVLDGNNSSFELPTPMAGSVSVLREVSWFKDGIGINVMSSAGAIQVEARDTRSRFRLIGEQIAVEHKPLGKLTSSWRDKSGNVWLRYEDIRQGQQPNFAEVRWSQRLPRTALEVRSILKPGLKSFLFSRLRWTGEGKGRVLTFEKFFPDGKVASTLVMSDWKPTNATLDGELAKIPVGKRTFDRRLGEDKPLNYEWPGYLPSTAKLNEMKRAGVALPSYAVGNNLWVFLAVGGVVCLGGGLLVSIRRRGRTRPPSEYVTK